MIIPLNKWFCEGKVVLQSRRGTAYVEYFILAAAVAAAALWLWDTGNFRGARTTLERQFEKQMSQIAGFKVAMP